MPPGIKDESTFDLYKLEPGKDGRKKKVPYRTSGAMVDSGNKAHLTDFTTAYEKYSKGGYDGMELSVLEDIVAVDIDDCIRLCGRDAPASAGALGVSNRLVKLFMMIYTK